MHSLQLRKRTEAFFGVSRLQRLSVCGSRPALKPISALGDVGDRMHLLAVGDSLSCGYGVLGTYPCTFSPQTEDVFHSWAHVTAAEMGAQLDLVCWSGKGVVRNYGSPNVTSPDPMPLFWNRTLGNDAVARWQGPADVVVVVLGGNDFSTQPSPPPAMWSAAVTAFVATLRAAYPVAHIVTSCGPLPKDPCALMQSTTALIAQRDARVSFVGMNAFDYADHRFLGCDGHPNTLGQQLMADRMIAHLRHILA